MLTHCKNDLAALTGPALVAPIRAFVNAVIDSCHPRVIVVSQLTLFLRNNHLANRVRYVNAQLHQAFASFVGGTCMVYRKYRIGIWGPNRHHMYARDGVHLSRTGLVRYCHSVRQALVRMMNEL